MNFLERLLLFFDSKMTVPSLYGWFHILFLALTAAAMVLAWRFGPKLSSKQVHNIVLITAIVVTVLEIYKQINYTFTVTDAGIVAKYQWYAFPFQFCSTPMYVGLLAGMFRKGKLSDCLCAYLATYAVFAGLVVMLYPGDVFIQTIGINIQTMICHGSMLPIGCLLVASGRVKVEWKTLLRAAIVFICAVLMACLMNEITYYIGLDADPDFNMFYISRHCDPHLPVFSLIQPLVPFPVSLLIYISAFTVAGGIMLLLLSLPLRHRGHKIAHPKPRKIPAHN